MTPEEFLSLFSHLVMYFIHNYDPQFFLISGSNKWRTSYVPPTEHICCCECDGCEPLSKDDKGNMVGCVPDYNKDDTECPMPTEDEMLSALFYVYLQAQTGVFDKMKLDKRSRWLVS